MLRRGFLQGGTFLRRSATDHTSLRIVWVLYDNVPGGAGHFLELLSPERTWLEAARETMFVDEEHDKICETACLDCLLTFGAQESMRLGLLQRRLTLKILDALLQGGSLPVVEVDVENAALFMRSAKARSSCAFCACYDADCRGAERACEEEATKGHK